MRPRRGQQAAIQVLVVCAALGWNAAAQQVSTDYDHKAPFNDYKTFSILKIHTANPLNEQRVRDGITAQLTRRGLHEVPADGNVSISAVGGLQTEQQYNTFYDGLGPRWGWGGWGYRGWGGWGGGGAGQSTTTVQHIPVGTLRVDMYDGNSNQLVWRGLASDQLSNKPDKNVKKLNKAMDKMFDKFPPRGGS